MSELYYNYNDDDIKTELMELFESQLTTDTWFSNFEATSKNSLLNNLCQTTLRYFSDDIVPTLNYDRGELSESINQSLNNVESNITNFFKVTLPDIPEIDYEKTSYREECAYQAMTNKIDILESVIKLCIYQIQYDMFYKTLFIFNKKQCEGKNLNELFIRDEIPKQNKKHPELKNYQIINL